MGKENGNGQKKEYNILAINIYTGGFGGLQFAHLFAEQIDQPMYVEHSAKTDKLDVKSEYLGLDLSQEKSKETAKFTEVNKKIDELREKQIRYILTKICEKNKKDIKAVDDYMKEKPTGKSFIEKVKELKLITDKDGNVLNTNGGIFDKTKAGPFGQRQAMLSDEEINKIIKDSALVENLGKPKKEDFDLMVNNLNSNKRLERYNTELGLSIKNITIENDDELESAFGNCFDMYSSPINYERLKKAKIEYIKNKMNARYENDRTEKAFVEECEKLDTALKNYYFPAHNVKVDEQKAYNNLTKEEYEKIALDSIPPTSLSKEVEKNFKGYMNNCRSNKSKIVPEVACAYVKHLENIHKKRPFMTRFFDYFKNDGEWKTLNRIKDTLNKKLGKDVVDETLKRNDLKYQHPSFEGRFQTLSDGKIPTMADFNDKFVDDVLNKADETIEAEMKHIEEKRQMKNDISTALNNKKQKSEIVTEKVTETKVVALEKENDTLQNNK